MHSRAVCFRRAAIDTSTEKGRAAYPRVRVSQERLGMMPWLTRQTVNELLQQMEKESIIECERGGVRVLDLARLKRAGRDRISS